MQLFFSFSSLLSQRLASDDRRGLTLKATSFWIIRAYNFIMFVKQRLSLGVGMEYFILYVHCARFGLDIPSPCPQDGFLKFRRDSKISSVRLTSIDLHFRIYYIFNCKMKKILDRVIFISLSLSLLMFLFHF